MTLLIIYLSAYGGLYGKSQACEEIINYYII